MKIINTRNLKFLYFNLDKFKNTRYNKYRNIYGDVAQLARASGSYPAGREFESPRRYQFDD